MSDEEKVNVETAAPAPKKKHWPIVLSALAVIVIAVLVAFLHWHEQPTFCSTMCHSVMQKYVDGYYSEDPALGAAQHEAADVTCLGCHWSQAKMLDLVHEVVMFVTDEFTDPLPDQSQFVTDEFCGVCHDGVTAQTKEAATADWTYDPHNIPEGVAMHEGQDFACGSCHSVHKQSTMVCASCHADIEVPTGWAIPVNENQAAALVTYTNGDGIEVTLDPHSTDYIALNAMHATAGSNGAISCTDCHDTNTIACAVCHADAYADYTVPEGWTLGTSEAKAATAEAYGIYDPHAGDLYVQFSTMHETAGADGGVIACVDCHATKTIVCAECHESVFTEENLPEGWTLSVSEARAATAETYGVFDPHSTAYIPFSTTHEAASPSNGIITCADCHDAQVIACGRCHLPEYSDNLPEGWTVPENGIDIVAMMHPADEADEDASDDAAADSGDAVTTAENAADGEYTATGKGIGGDVPVTVTIKDGKITSVAVGDNNETQGIGSRAIEQLPDLIVAANGTDGVDGVSSATITSNAIFTAVQAALAEASA